MEELLKYVKIGVLSGVVGLGIGYSLNVPKSNVKFADLNDDGHLDAIISEGNLQFYKGREDGSFLLVGVNDVDYKHFKDSYAKLYRLEERLSATLLNQLDNSEREIPVDLR